MIVGELDRLGLEPPLEKGMRKQLQTLETVAMMEHAYLDLAGIIEEE